MTRPRESERGIALLMVLIALGLLVSLVAPFVMNARNRGKASGLRADAARAREAAEAGVVHARASLAATFPDPSFDATPLFDGLGEMAVPRELDGRRPGSSDAPSSRDPRALLLDVRGSDEQARVDLRSVTPHFLAALLGRLTHVREAVDETADVIEVDSTDGFPDEGFLWIAGELVSYRSKSNTAFTQVDRAVAGEQGFSPARGHRPGTAVMPERFYAFHLWRTEGTGGDPRRIDSVRDLLRAAPWSLEGGFSREEVAQLADLVTVHAGGAGAEIWSDPVRAAAPLIAGATDFVLPWDGQYFGVGTTVRISAEGREEFGLVADAQPGASGFRLAAPVRNEYEPAEALVSFLVRHPININTAAPELLRLVIGGIRLTPSRGIADPTADLLTDAIVASRPIRGIGDLLGSVLWPLQEDGDIDGRTVDSVTRLALAAEDRTLRASLHTLGFRNEGRFRVLSNASVNTPTGAERGRHSTERVLSVAPQEPLLHVVSTQVEFEESWRPGRAARWTATGPDHVGIPAGAVQPPSRAPAYLGRNSAGSPTLPSADAGESFVQILPSRKESAGIRVFHWDAEQDMEGYDVSQAGLALPPGHDTVRLDLSGGLAPGAIEGWFRPSSGTGTFFDIGSGEGDRNRVRLAWEDAEVVLRLWDDIGDDPTTAEVEAGTIRWTPDAGLPAETWHHLGMSFRGSKPSDLTLLVDGSPRGERDALTRLTAALDEAQPDGTLPGSPVPGGVIAVESTVGFPAVSVLRIGQELIEARVTGPTTFDAAWISAADDPAAFTGGRLARDVLVNGVPAILAAETSHAVGETVALYGYTDLFAEDVLPGGSSLPAPLGKFSCGRLASEPDDIVIPGPPGPGGVPVPLLVGTGIEGAYGGDLDLVDPTDGSDPNFIGAFSPTGGYAVIMQSAGVPAYGGVPAPFQATLDPKTTTIQTPYIGVELITYSGVSGNSLTGVARAQISQYSNTWSMTSFAGTNAASSGYGDAVARAFVVTWESWVPQPTAPAKLPYVIPISIAGAGDVAGTYREPINGPEFVQIYDQGSEETCEWVRYNSFGTTTAGRSWFVRDSANRIGSLFNTVGRLDPADYALNPAESNMAGYLGAREERTNLTARMDRSLSMRGVHRTFDHGHESGALLNPVFHTRLRETDVLRGRPGRADRVAIAEAGGGAPFWGTVNWTYRRSTLDEEGNFHRDQLVALKEPLPTLYVASGPSNEDDPYDSRNYTRLTKFPAGEMPGIVDTVAVAQNHFGGASPGGLIDEVQFHTRAAPGGTGLLGAVYTGGSFDSEATQIPVSTMTVMLPMGFGGDGNTNYLDSFPETAGVVQIGEELIAYTERDTGTGVLTVAPDGRGFLGTTASAHSAWEPVEPLDHLVVGELTGGLGPEDGSVILENGDAFGALGCLRVGDELLHYSWRLANTLEMPRRTNADGSEGPGLFRGRFGTPPLDHEAGVVALEWPFRYWDRGALQADAPDLGYFAVRVDRPGGFYGALAWEEELPEGPFDVVALLRTDETVAWDADPALTPGLWQFNNPQLDTFGNAIESLGDRCDVRFLFLYGAGAFDPFTNAEHAWKRSPRLNSVYLRHLQPIRTLWREDS